MRYHDLKCPECGQQASECVDNVMAHQPFTVTGDGDLDWGLSTPIWETSTGTTDAQGRELIRCPDGHEWFSRVEGVDHDRPKTVALAIEDYEVEALNDLLEKAIEVLELEGTRDDEAQSAKVNAVDRLQHKLAQALKGADVQSDAEHSQALA